MKIAFIFSLFCICIISCKKNDVFTNDGLTGKWKLKQMYDGYAMGGHFQWTPVPDLYSHTLEFYNNGRYELRSFSANTGFYKGAYLLLNDSTLARTSTGQADSTFFFNNKIKLSPAELIIDYPNMEGVIRYKYSAIGD